MIIFGGDFVNYWQRNLIFEFLHFLTNLDSAWLRQSPLVNSLQHRFFQFHLRISTFQDPKQRFNQTTQKKRNLVSNIFGDLDLDQTGSGFDFWLSFDFG